MTTTVGFIGLGLMGTPMAKRLLAAGYDVVVYNRSHEKCEPLRKAGAIVVAHPREMASKTNLIILCVTDGNAVNSILFDANDGVLSADAKELIIIDHSTTGTKAVDAIIEKLKLTTIKFTDAPVTGGPTGAEQGKLVIFCGGDRQTFNSTESVMKSYAAAIHYLGSSGSGQATKMCNQILAFSSIYTAYEMIGVAKKQGMDIKKFISCFDGALFDSPIWQMVVEAERNPNTPQLAHLKTQAKDLALVLESATSVDAYTPITVLVNQLADKLMQQGYGECDPRACIKHLFD